MNELAPTVENIEENNPIFEEDLMLFVDQNSDYYKKKWDNTDPKKKGFSFNAGGFFFTFFWLGYRKMYELVFFISLSFLAIDAFLYVICYQYEVDSFIEDRKSTRLNSSHVASSYAVLCSNKKRRTKEAIGRR